MSHTTVKIAGVELDAEYEYDIIRHGSPATYHDPAEPAEFNIEVLSLKFPKQHADVPDLYIPDWLKDLLNTHLAERDDINDIVQNADMDRDDSDD